MSQRNFFARASVNLSAVLVMHSPTAASSCANHYQQKHSRDGRVKQPGRARMHLASHGHQRVHHGTSEPPSVALLRHVLNPSVIVLSLLFCVFLYGQPLTPAYFALAALAFLISAQVVSDPVLDCSVRGRLSTLLQHRIFAEWLLVSAVLLLMAFAFKVTEKFSRRVILTWFAITPFAVVAAQKLFRRYAAFLGAARQDPAEPRHHRREREWLAARAAAGSASASRRLQGLLRRSLERSPARPAAGAVARRHAGHRQLRAPERREQYLYLPADSRRRRDTKLLEELKDTTASVYFVPDIFMFDLMQAQVCELDGIPLLAVCETPFAGLNGVIKRASDIVISSRSVVVALAGAGGIAIGVRASSPGPVLFSSASLRHCMAKPSMSTSSAA